MTKLVLRGHATRGNEVIEILEMLGGVNKYQIGAVRQTCVYFLDIDGIIRLLQISQLRTEQYIVYSLEEFLEKYPYKVGDKVTLDNKLCSIIWMCWECNNIYYQVQGIGDVFTKKVTADELNLYKEETMEKEEENFAECIEKTIQECLFGKEGATKEIKIDIPKGYEFAGIDDDNQQVVFEKIGYQYPKTYEECCEVLNLGEDGNLYTKGHQASLIQDFHKLFICRAAYWKIAGEQMGLDKPWEPDWDNDEIVKYCIIVDRNIISKPSFRNTQFTFAFPTAEMRDVFYENFKDLINEVEELL